MTNILFPKDLLEKIISIIRNFWWKENKQEGAGKSICFRSWEDICQPKHLGGLGIKNIITVSKSLVTHSAWMVAAQKDTFLSNVLKAKYHPHSSFWKATSTGSRSVFWSSIQNVKHFIHKNCSYQIQEGSINIWSDPWCPIWDNIHSHLVLSTTVFPLPNQVKDLLIHNEHVWNTSLINQVFDNHAAQIILTTPIVQQQSEDILI
ncbi:hypothetical protein BS78_07G110700 [Paspalum vaginatum]|nr:hypothetical protein BS78_07G110700 [Paspalum vaginatum]